MSVNVTDFNTKFEENFRKCVRGYHKINTDPIKEATWEAINSLVFQASGCDVVSQSSGSHAPGSDITCALGNMSNKSAKFDHDTGCGFSISSYRLTKVCGPSLSEGGDIGEIIAEINKRKNFEYYSVIVRREREKDLETDYSWYLIPASHPALLPESYTWSPMMGKQGKNKGKQIGWETDEIAGQCKMKIVFSMSSQLWMTLGSEAVSGMEEFCVARTTASNTRVYNYLQLDDLLLV